LVDEMIKLAVQPRTVLGKEVKRLRWQSLTPIHLYGRGISPMALQLDSTMLRDALVRVGKSRPLSIEVDGNETPYISFVRDIQFHPLDSSVLHVDFLVVDASRFIEVAVPVFLEGDAPAARMLGGSLIQLMNSVRIQASPLDIPPEIRVNVSYLNDFSKAIRVLDLVVPPGATIMSDPNLLVARVNAPVATEVAGGDVAAPAPLMETKVVTQVVERGEESP